jgi:hypothetical protein
VKWYVIQSWSGEFVREEHYVTATITKTEQNVELCIALVKIIKYRLSEANLIGHIEVKLRCVQCRQATRNFSSSMVCLNKSMQWPLLLYILPCGEDLYCV